MLRVTSTRDTCWRIGKYKFKFSDLTYLKFLNFTTFIIRFYLSLYLHIPILKKSLSQVIYYKHAMHFNHFYVFNLLKHIIFSNITIHLLYFHLLYIS